MSFDMGIGNRGMAARVLLAIRICNGLEIKRAECVRRGRDAKCAGSHMFSFRTRHARKFADAKCALDKNKFALTIR